MKILILTSESWNDVVNPNNNLTNWFSGMSNIEIAVIYGSPDLPYNHQCKKYFQVSESMMARSMISSARAGKVLNYEQYPDEKAPVSGAEDEKADKEKVVYRFFKAHSNEFVRLLRDVIWNIGRYDLEKLQKFIRDFDPDIVFTQRMGSVKMCRIEQIVHSITDTPFVAYTGDDEYSLKQISYSPVYWIRRLWVRSKLKKNIPFYKLFYSMSYDQMEEFKREFGSRTKLLVKSGVFRRDKVHRNVHDPVRIVYVGKMYCNRWKTLSLLGECIKTANESNPDGIRFRLETYTRDKLNDKQKAVLHDGVNSFLMGPIKPNDILALYQNSDIVLHVEGLDKRNKLLTKYSFSTKVMDCLSSGCAVMVISWEKHSAFEYLKEKDAAMTAASKEELMRLLLAIQENPELVAHYAEKAYQCGSRYHQKEQIQKQLLIDFQNVIDNA